MSRKISYNQSLRLRVKYFSFFCIAEVRGEQLDNPAVQYVGGFWTALS